jgi:5-methylthioadenosine/S-adenosylhomocysteine deaminase
VEGIAGRRGALLRTLLRRVYYVDAFMEEAKRGDILIDGDSIVEIGEEIPISEDMEVLDCKFKKAVIPGLVNAHTHAAMTLLRGLGEERPLKEWLEEKIWPVEAKLTPEDIYWGTSLALLEMTSMGVTAFADMYFEMEEVGSAAQQFGARCALAKGIIGTDESNVEKTLSLIDHFKGQELVNVQIGPHAPYTVPAEMYKRLCDLALDKGVGVHTHFMEAPWERGFLMEKYGMTPVDFLENSGLLSVPVALLAHCVWMEEEEIEKMSCPSVQVAHNPSSNLKLGSGIAPLRGYLDRGVTVSLGTDGAASNNRLDVWEEMRLAALLHKGKELDPTCCKAKEVLKMATFNGARALGFDKVGRIERSWKADLAMIDLDKPHYVGFDCANLVHYLVYAGSSADVVGTMVNGVWVYYHGNYKYKEAEFVRERAQKSRERICS